MERRRRRPTDLAEAGLPQHGREPVLAGLSTESHAHLLGQRRRTLITVDKP